MTRHFLRDDDLSPSEQAVVVAQAGRMKADRFAARPLEGPRSVALIFDKATLRTQLSFSAGVSELGGFPVSIDGAMAGIGVREPISDCAQVLGRQVAAIVWRTFGQARIEEMARYAGVPVVNALTDEFHPCQILADLLTITEHRGRSAGVTAAYVGDAANNMAHSYLLGFATAGMHVRVGGPNIDAIDQSVLVRSRQIATDTGGSITLTGDPQEAVDGAEVLLTDTWVSMGREGEAAERKGEASPFAPFRIDTALLSRAAPDAVVMHCLPAYRGFEISAEVIDGPRSLVFDEAENRLHVQKALLAFLLDQQ